MGWLIFLLFSLGGNAPAAPSTEPVNAAAADFERFFADYAKKRDGIQVLEARFVQKTIYPDEILTTNGKLIYAKPRRLVFQTEDPERTTLVDEQRVYEYEPEIKQMTMYDIGDNPQADIFFFGFDNDTESLRKSYDVQLLTLPDEPKGSHGLLIKPKPENAPDARFVEVTLYLRDKDYLPHRIRIVNDEESQVIVEIKDMAVNGKIDPSSTQIALAEGTKIIENDTPVETVGAGGKRVPEAAPLPAENIGAANPDQKPAAPEKSSDENADDQVTIKDLPPPGAAQEKP